MLCTILHVHSFVLSKPKERTSVEHFHHILSAKECIQYKALVFPDSAKFSLFIANDTVHPISDSFCSRDIVWRFDLLANGGASLTLSYERAPFPTAHRTVWLPWNVFHVMDTVVMKREENDIPSCYLTGLIRPNPLILATPLSTLYKSSPEDSPIIPETQVRLQSPQRQRENTSPDFYGQFQILAHIWLFWMT